ncbi:MAG: hypothetical protein V4515_04530 [Chloroflexota bacterium]
MPSQRPRPARRSTRARTTFRPSSRVPWLRRSRRTKPFLTPATAAGVPILQDVLDGARLLVEVGFGVDTTTSPAGWTWVDVTTDVQVADGAMVELFRGRGSEADRAQPATASIRLDNRAGRYSTDTSSVYWPYVRRNTPVRVSIDPGTGTFYVRFVGFADGWPAKWDDSRNSAWVELSASGTFRRLSQAARPVLSSMRRALLDLDNVVAYWPAEDGKNSPTFASAFGDHPPMTIIGAPELAANSSFECTDPIPTMKDGAFRGVVPTYTATGEIQVRFLLDTPDSGHDANFTILSVQTSGTAARWDLQYRTGSGGSLAMVAYSRSGSQILDTGNIGFAMNGHLRRLTILLSEDGADVDLQFSTLEVGFSLGLTWSETVVGRTVGRATTIAVNPDRAVVDLGIGQFSVQDEITSIFAESPQLNANVGESPTTRFARLCDENGLFYVTYNTVIGDDTLTMNMGSQLSGQLLELIREVEDADGGMIYDGHTEGLTFRTLKSIENQDAALTLDAAAGDISAGFAPVDDDSRNVNRYTASRRDGASVTLSDDTGPLGTTAVGLYDGSGTFSIQRDARVVDLAGWELHLGTTDDGYRFPELNLNLARTPDLAVPWAGTLAGDRVDVENIATVLPQLAAGDRSFLLLGSSETFSQHEWYATMHLGPYGPYGRTGVLADDVDDVGPYVLRAHTDGSTVAASVTQGASSITVATPTGPIWVRTSQRPEDFPLTITVQGVEIEVTAISGSTSPQTFTVTPADVTQNLSLGQPVELARPTVLGR